MTTLLADGPAANKVVIYGALVPRCVEPEGVAKIRPRGRKVEPFEATCHVITRLERNIVWKPGSFLLFREQIFQSHVCRGYGKLIAIWQQFSQHFKQISDQVVPLVS